MDRKGLIIIIVTLGLAFGWHFFYLKPEEDKQLREYKEKRAKYDAEMARIKEEEAKKAAANPAPNPTVQPALEKPAPAVAPAEPAVPEEKKIVSSEAGTVDYVFSNLGGGISRVVLKDHYEDKKKSTLIVLNEFGDIPIGALAEQPGELAQVRVPWTMSVDAPNFAVVFERTIPAMTADGKPLGQIKATKRYTLPRKADENDRRRVKLRSEYLMGLDITYQNVGQTPIFVPKYFLHLGGAAPINQLEMPLYGGFDYWRDGDTHFKNIDSFGAGGFLFWTHPEQPVFKVDADLIRWGAVTNQYFTTMVTILDAAGRPEDEQRRVLGVSAWAKRRAISPEEWRKPTDWRPTGLEYNGKAKLFQVDGAIAVPEFALTPGQAETRKFQIYAGPRELRRLRLLDHHEKDVLDYGSFLGIPTGFFSEMLLNAMNGLYFYVTKSYALAIILLTIIVKAILWPLQSKANRSMKKMAALQPEMKALQEKHKADPAKFQQEMGKMWKKAGVNPLSGCWPIFIQIPIFIGFYNMLGKAVELRHHGFLWVQDLAAPDTVAVLFGWLAINPLPLIMAASMFLQMKMAPQGGDPMQRKIFMFMPLIFIFICYNFASALALYWTVQNIISIVQLLLNRDRNAPPASPAPAK